jgi:hypothetical protein
MTAVYINYPNARFTLHPGMPLASCVVQDKPNRKTIRITPDSFSAELPAFIDGQLQLAFTSEFNDTWIDLDFGDEEFEKSLAEYIQRLIGHRYSRLASASLS